MYDYLLTITSAKKKKVIMGGMLQKTETQDERK